MVCHINIVEISFEQLLKHDIRPDLFSWNFFFFLQFLVGNFKERFGEKISLKSIGYGAENI